MCCLCFLPLQSWLKDASNTFQGLDGPVSTSYAGLTASLLAAGLGYMFAPGLTLAGVTLAGPHAEPWHACTSTTRNLHCAVQLLEPTLVPSSHHCQLGRAVSVMHVEHGTCRPSHYLCATTVMHCALYNA